MRELIVPRFDFRVDVAVAEDIGSTRARHEDAHLMAPEAALFAVADGMGGEAAGEIAAKLALARVREELALSQTVLEHYVNRPSLEARRRVFNHLRRAVERANEAVRADAAANPERAGMGSTIDVVWLARKHAFVAHAGDGRVYLARARATIQLTQDHGRVASLQAKGALTPGKKARHSGLMNAVGLADRINVDTLFVDVSRGDRLLLCTDGVHAALGDEDAVTELLRRGDANEAAQALVDFAKREGRDNATALVLEIGERFVKRIEEDRGLAAADLDLARQSALLSGLPMSSVLAALSAAVEVELPAGETVPQVVANDLVSYILLDGVLTSPEGKRISTGALVFPESLVGVWVRGRLPRVEEQARLLRVRADDFTEVCEDPSLGVQLFRRLAEHLARSQPSASARESEAPPAKS